MKKISNDTMRKITIAKTIFMIVMRPSFFVVKSVLAVVVGITTINSQF